MAHWVAHYSDGSKQTSEDITYDKIDRSKLAAIQVVHEGKSVLLHLGGKKRLIMRRLGFLDFNKRTGEGSNRKEGIWTIGYEEDGLVNKRTTVVYFSEFDGSVQIVDGWPTGRPELRDEEK